MPVIIDNVPAASSDREVPETIEQGSGPRRMLTLVRMGLAFFFPWPFGTDRLKTAVAARSGRLHPSSARRPGKS